MSFSTMPVSDLRKSINAILSRLVRPIFVTQHGRVKAVLMDIEHYNELMDEIDDMRDACDPEVQHAAAAARQARKRGETVPLEDAPGKHGL
jgi:prevent-host-death family protein